MLIELVLLFVGAVLVLNGLWMLGQIADHEIIVINVVVGIITALVAGATATDFHNITSVKSASFTLLFTTTYLWVAYNRVVATDGKGLGWFSLFVAITVLPKGLIDLTAATSTLDVWLGLNWVLWSGLWFMYFLLLTIQRPIQKITAICTLLVGIFTGWLPGVLLLYGAF